MAGTRSGGVWENVGFGFAGLLKGVVAGVGGGLGGQLGLRRIRAAFGIAGKFGEANTRRHVLGEPVGIAQEVGVRKARFAEGGEHLFERRKLARRGSWHDYLAARAWYKMSSTSAFCDSSAKRHSSRTKMALSN